MDFTAGASMILPDIENVYDEEDNVHEQTNQNEIVELIMAAFEGHDEPSDDDDESLNTSGSSQQSNDLTQILNFNNNNSNNTNEQYVQEQTEKQPPSEFLNRSFLTLRFIHPQSHFPSPKLSASPTIVPLNEIHAFQSEANLPFNYPTTSSTAFHFVPDSMQNQYCYQTSTNQFHETQNQLNKLRILCSVKDRKACQLQHLCEEFREKYESDTQTLQHQLELSEKSKDEYKQNYQALAAKYEQVVHTNHQLYRTIEDAEKIKTQLLESNKCFQDQIEELTRSKEDHEILLKSLQEKHEEEIVSSNEKRIQFDELQQSLTELTKDKTQLDIEYQDLQSEVRTLRERLNDYEIQIRTQTERFNQRDSLELSAIDQSIINENLVLKERINEYIMEQNQLRHFNEELNKKLQDCHYPSKRSDSLSSSSSSNSTETVITTSVHMEQIKRLTNQLEQLKKEHSDLNERVDYEKQELNTIIEQLREDSKDLDQTKQLYINVCHEKNLLEDTFRTKIDELYHRFEQDKQSMERKYQSEFESLKIKYEKQINDLKIELDRLHTNDDAKKRLIYTENEFEQLKHDYYTLNTKYSDLLKAYSSLEHRNESLHQSTEQSQHEKQTSQNEIVHLNEQNQTLQKRFNHLEHLIKQYEEYRTKIESNLQKILEQRDMHKQELQLTKEMLTNKENDFNQLQTLLAQCEKHLQISQSQNQETNDQFQLLRVEKSQTEQRLKEANHALHLADYHLKQEIDKIKTSLEQEYQRRYDREHKQDASNAAESEDLKKVYRIEMDRLYHENRELSQHQTKLTDAHQKQMQILKKDLETGYINVIQELEREQTRLQTRYDQLKQHLTDAEQTIEQLKYNLNQLKTAHQKEISRIQDSVEYDHRNQKENVQNRLDNLAQLLEQSNNALNYERAMHTKQKQEYQQTIESLQKQLTVPSARPMSASTLPSQKNTGYLGTMDKLRELFTTEMIALLRLTCQMIFDVHHRVTVARWMENLDIDMRKQLRNELIRSRNSMIKEIRREIFDKMTQALKSQGVPDTSIDIQIFELDRLLSQIVQDCLNSLPPSSPSSSTLSFQISPSPRQYHATSCKSPPPPQKSIEYLYMTPTVNKKSAPLAPHCRPKSASHVVLVGSTSSSPPQHFHRSENDLAIAMEESEDEDEKTLTAESDEMTSANLRYATTKILHHQRNINNDDPDELTWPQQPLTPSSSSHGIKKFVRNSLKLFITQPQPPKKSSK